jgi:hypothetical protein
MPLSINLIIPVQRRDPADWRRFEYLTRSKLLFMRDVQEVGVDQPSVVHFITYPERGREVVREIEAMRKQGWPGKVLWEPEPVSCIVIKKGFLTR